jgi:hypothetical protein
MLKCLATFQNDFATWVTYPDLDVSLLEPMFPSKEHKLFFRLTHFQSFWPRNIRKLGSRQGQIQCSEEAMICVGSVHERYLLRIKAASVIPLRQGRWRMLQPLLHVSVEASRSPQLKTTVFSYPLSQALSVVVL